MDNFHRLTLQSICSGKLVSITTDTSVPDVIRLMREKRLSSLVVLDKSESLAGIVTESNIVNAASSTDINSIFAADIMTSPVIYASSGMLYHEAYHLLTQQIISHLVVVNHVKQPISIVTSTDFIHHLDIEHLMDVRYVDDVVDHKLHFIPTSTNLKEAFQLFSESTANCLIVGSRTDVQGILTEKDMVRLLDKKIDLHTSTVQMVMHKPVFSVSYGTTLSETRALMIAQNCHLLLVTDEHGYAAGIVTQKGLISGVESRYIGLLQESVLTLNHELAAAEKEIQENRFAQALEHVAARMLNATDINTLLSESITDLCKVLCADRVSLLLANDAEFSSATILYESCTPDFPGALAQSNQLPFTAEMQEAAKKTLDENSIFIEHDSPSSPLHTIYQHWKIKTLFNAPLRIKHMNPAFLSVHFCKESHQPSSAELRLLQEFTAYFSSAMTSQYLQERLAQDIKTRETAEQHLQAILNTLPHGIQENDLSGLITFTNPAYHKILGYEAGEMAGKYIWDLGFSKKDRAKTKALFTTFLSELPTPFPIETTKAHKNGTPVDIRLNWSYQFNQEGGVVGFLSVITDITASKAAGKALEASEHKYQTFFEDSSDAILILNPQDWSVFEANPKATQMFGFTEQITQFPASSSKDNKSIIIITELSPFKNTVFDNMQTAFNKGEKSFRGHGYCVSCSGQRIPVEISATQLNAQDQPMVIATLHDQSFQLDAEERLQQSAVVFENSLEGVIITDAFTRIISINKAFENITGYSEKDVLGQKPAILRSGRHNAAFYHAMWSEVRRNRQWTGEVWNRRKNGEIYPQLLTITAILDKKDDVQNYVAVFSDVSALKASQQALEHQAHYDSLTGLPNKLLLEARVLHLLEHQQRSNEQFAVLFLDLDHFKNINDSLGHVAGDTLLIAVTERLQQCIRQDDTLARLGGDEFVFILEDIQQVKESALMAEKIIDQLSLPFTIADQEVYISVSIGISLTSKNNETYDELISNADAAMFQAKAEGRNTYQYYSKEMTSLAFERLSFEAMMRQSLQANDFVLYYQPQIRLADEELIGYEALIRWQHPSLGLVMPDKFIAIAEESSIILALGEWVLFEACRKGKQLLDAGKSFNYIAINVSVPQLKKGDFLSSVKAALAQSGFPAQKLEIEITESFLMGNELEATRVLNQLHNMGIHIAIDDFGTGYSSLNYLKQLPIDKLKIDRSFIQHLPSSHKDRAIVQTVIALGQALGLEIIAEGVETQEQKDLLLSLGCFSAQGYLYSRPLALDLL
jgi:diguanylate cyclase (GGDEF)-like protein/PAS domain S-box-containing protein